MAGYAEPIAGSPGDVPVSSDGSNVVGPGEMERGDTRTEFGSAGQSEKKGGRNVRDAED
jgi:hypothetical protein